MPRGPAMKNSFKSLGQALARAASDKKAEEIVLLDVRRQSPIIEYMLIATANSQPHLEAIEYEVSKAAKEMRRPALRRARPESALWRVLDFGGLMAHFMTEDSRRFYDLEQLDHPARPVAWEEEKAPPARRKAPQRARRRARS